MLLERVELASGSLTGSAFDVIEAELIDIYCRFCRRCRSVTSRRLLLYVQSFNLLLLTLSHRPNTLKYRYQCSVCGNTTP